MIRKLEIVTGIVNDIMFRNERGNGTHHNAESPNGNISK